MGSNANSHTYSQPDIKVTKWDLNRLDQLLASHATTWSWRAVEFLVRELIRAEIIDEKDAPGNFVTMRSRVAFRVDDSEIDEVVTLAYPSDRDYEDALSVLTPIGAALIGLSEGQSINYSAPDGRRKSLTVLKLISQPERNGYADGEMARRSAKTEHGTQRWPLGASNPAHETGPCATTPPVTPATPAEVSPI